MAQNILASIVVAMIWSLLYATEDVFGRRLASVLSVILIVMIWFG